MKGGYVIVGLLLSGVGFFSLLSPDFPVICIGALIMGPILFIYGIVADDSPKQLYTPYKPTYYAPPPPHVNTPVQPMPVYTNITVESCPRCNNVVEEEWQICPYCKMNLIKQIQRDYNNTNVKNGVDRRCVECDKAIAFDALFCAYCGHDHRDTEQRPVHVRRSPSETRKIKQESKPLPPPPPPPPPQYRHRSYNKSEVQIRRPPETRTIAGQTKRTGICQNCGSRNIRIYDDGSGMCNDCKRAFI